MNEQDQIRRTDAAELFTQLILETFRFNGRLIAAGDRLTKDFGLTSATWQVLGAIQEVPLSMAQIARDKGLTRQSVRRTASLLESKGFVEFRDNPDHLRAKLVTLTHKGREMLDKVTEVQIEWANRISQEMKPKELEGALRTFQGLCDRL